MLRHGDHFDLRVISCIPKLHDHGVDFGCQAIDISCVVCTLSYSYLVLIKGFICVNLGFVEDASDKKHAMPSVALVVRRLIGNHTTSHYF